MKIKLNLEIPTYVVAGTFALLIFYIIMDAFLI